MLYSKPCYVIMPVKENGGKYCSFFHYFIINFFPTTTLSMFKTAECTQCTDREPLCWFKVSLQLALHLHKEPGFPQRSPSTSQNSLNVAPPLHFPSREMISLWNRGWWHLFSCWCLYNVCKDMLMCIHPWGQKHLLWVTLTHHCRHTHSIMTLAGNSNGGGDIIIAMNNGFALFRALWPFRY